MPIGFDDMLLLSMLSSGVNAASGSAAAGRNRKNQQQMHADELAQQERQSQRGTALSESKDDPFRQQLAQAQAIARLDLMANGSLTPRKITPPANRYASYVPEMSGGFSYEQDPQMQGDAEALKQSVRAGRTAPSVVSPENYGKSATLNLPGVADGSLDPTSDAAFSYGAPNRDALDAPPPAPLPPAAANNSRRSQLRHDTRQTKAIQEFERLHPGWTLDPATGRTIRKVA